VRALGYDDVNLGPHQLEGQLGKPPVTSISETGLDNDILSFYISKFTETLPE
jgi:hypothetical protein